MTLEVRDRMKYIANRYGNNKTEDLYRDLLKLAELCYNGLIRGPRYKKREEVEIIRIEEPKFIKIKSKKTKTNEDIIKYIVAKNDISPYSKCMNILDQLKPDTWTSIHAIPDELFMEFWKHIENIREVDFDSERGDQYFKVAKIKRDHPCYRGKKIVISV